MAHVTCSICLLIFYLSLTFVSQIAPKSITLEPQPLRNLTHQFPDSEKCLFRNFPSPEAPKQKNPRCLSQQIMKATMVYLLRSRNYALSRLYFQEFLGVLDFGMFNLQHKKAPWRLFFWKHACDGRKRTAKESESSVSSNDDQL